MTFMRFRWALPAGSSFLILPPLLVFAVVNLLSVQFGEPAGYFAQPWAANGAAEAAGRMRTIAAFLLFAGLAVAVLVYSIGAFAVLDRRSARRILVSYLLTTAAGLSIVLWAGAFQGTPYLDQGFACASFSRLEAPQRAPERLRSALHAPADDASLPERPAPRLLNDEDRDPVRHCSVAQFRILHTLIVILGVLLVFALPAAIFGAITCLALPTGGSKEERLAAWSLQTKRLANFLYLAAGYMVSALLFISAQLHWVTYSLHPDDAGAFRDYANSIVLHSGISNSLMIAAYYIPTAAWSARLKPATAESGAAGGATAREAPTSADPFAPLGATMAILAPALIGLFGEVLKLGG